jgi:hypothetical protein
MERPPKLIIMGFDGAERRKYECSFNIKNLITCVDGYKLTELHIEAVLNDQKDIDELIALLKMAKYSFIK